MNRLIHRRRWTARAAVAAAFVGVLGAGIVMAEDMWVKRAFVEIRGGKGSLYPVVAKADQGAKLTVVAHDGRWVHVQFNGQDGYVLEDALSANQVGGDAFAGLHGSESSGATAASAGKGFTPEEFASSKGLSEAPLNQLEAEVKENVTPQGLEKFMADGKVGEDKPR